VTAAAAEVERADGALPPPPLHRQPLFVRFWAARSVSVFGDQVSALAIPLTGVLVLHASTFEVGLLTAMAWLPNLLFALPAGVWIDGVRHRRRVMIVADILRAAILATLPIAWWLGILTVAHLLVATFLIGSVTLFFDLASISFSINVIPRRQFVDAQSKLMTSSSVATISGPSIAGFLVQLLGAPVALLVDACSFIASAFLLRGTNVEEPALEPTHERPLQRLRSAFGFLLRDPVLRASLACTSTINFFNFVMLGVFIVFASRTLGLHAGTIGIVFGAGATGGLLGALIAPRVGRIVGMGRAVVIGAIVFPVVLIAFPLAHGSYAMKTGYLLFGEFVASIGVMIFDINQNSLLAFLVPENVRSRIFSAYRFVNYGTRPVGAVLGGVLGSAIGTRETMWVAVVGGAFGFLFLITSPLPKLKEGDFA
jgi:MFS family permease